MTYLLSQICCLFSYHVKKHNLISSKVFIKLLVYKSFFKKDKIYEKELNKERILKLCQSDIIEIKKSKGMVNCGKSYHQAWKYIYIGMEISGKSEDLFFCLWVIQQMLYASLCFLLYANLTPFYTKQKRDFLILHYLWNMIELVVKSKLNWRWPNFNAYHKCVLS